jgi:hypothetical protein
MCCFHALNSVLWHYELNGLIVQLLINCIIVGIDNFVVNYYTYITVDSSAPVVCYLCECRE